MDAYTYQSREILDTLELFIQMKVQGRRSEEPEKDWRPPSSDHTFEEKEIEKEDLGSLSKRSNGSMNAGYPRTPLNFQLDHKQSFITPSTFDL